MASDILVYELHKQLIDKIDINYSMDIRPSFVIKAAHQDSIVALAYLSHKQLLVSSSLDKTIKLWDVLSKPISLVNPSMKAFQQVKPGYY